MVQLVRWYLSAFHAGRRSQVAKKPYNPIIGETFRCSYDLPEMSDKKVSLLYHPAITGRSYSAVIKLTMNCDGKLSSVFHGKYIDVRG